MKKITTTLLMIIFFSSITNAQEDYKALWLKVEKLEVAHLPKSALKIVEEIYAKAAKDNNSAQLIKSLFYQSKFALILEEDAQLKVIQQFKKHISKSEFPTKNVLENVLANLYWQYFKKNRYTFYNRTKTKEKTNFEDFRTWDLNTLFEEIHTYFKASLENADALQKISISEFAPILHLQKGAENYRPTLYDFLANNALNFYKTSEATITKPSYQFKIDEPIYLSDVNTFSKLSLVTRDRLSLAFNTLKIYQKLIQFHQKSNNQEALVAIDLQRIYYVNTHGTFDDKESVFLKTLETSSIIFENSKESSLYAFEIAKKYYEKATTYSYSKNKEVRFKNKEAIDICHAIIEKYPKSLAAKKSIALKAQIERSSLSITAEKYIPIQQHSRFLIHYKNVDKLYFTAYKISERNLETFQKIHQLKKKMTLINVLEKAKTWQETLRNENDYLQHSTEIIAPAFEHGTYLIVASESEDLSEDQIYGTTSIQVSNLALIENNFEDKHNYQVVDRNTGKPIKNAEISLTNKIQRRGNRIHKNLKTDQYGFASFKSKKYYQNVSIAVKTKTDAALFGNYYLSENYRNHNSHDSKKSSIKPFIFTDRSIYRPGQTVYFKAIVIKKQGEQSEIVKDKFVKIVLEDVNGQEVEKLDLKLNEFGSVTGEFILPDNGLTGEYKIKVDESETHDVAYYKQVTFDYGVSYISVEAYKRPKFKTAFKPITDSFKINDSVTVKGFAKAFSGANITDAKVVYRVYRKVQYPSWYYWYKPNVSSEAQEITHGESSTDASGNFSITFKAIADESVSRESLPIFNYEITADVTDVNGETRSSKTLIKVGYHALLASIILDENIDKNAKENKLGIDTKNLNGTFVAAKGSLRIYKLESPKKPQRKRVWAAPDYQDIPEHIFRKLFPNEAYTDAEADAKKWKKGSLVFQQDFDTETTKEFLLKNSKKWISGKYIAILESKDKFGQIVKDEKKFTLFSTKEKQVADKQLFVINTDKTFYKVDDVVAIQIGSASKNVTVTVQVEKNHKIIETRLIRLNNSTKTIKIPVNKEDLGGFAIKYHFVNYNYFESGSLPINVVEAPKKLEIETDIFRNKLQPGQEETWSFSIKNDTNDKVTAEVLASMYDASLDEFKPHEWNFNPITPKASYYSYSKSEASNSFKNTYFNITNNRRNYYNYPSITHNTYNWFGFSLEGTWLNSTYLNDLKRKIASTRTDFDGIITGIVADEHGEALPGVSVKINNTHFGTTTDFDGNYTLKIKKGDVLSFTYLGYISREFSIDSQTNLNVQLDVDEDAVLDEVVISGYGTAKKETLTGSAFRLNGKVAGLGLMNQDTSQIRIRGFSSITAAKQPLYVVDGVLVNELTINESDIAKMTVLKDAAATSLYGARGVNGVIVITTKKAISQELLQVKARTNFKETAFFFPQLRTDKNGQVSFSFTMPEALTQWKLQLLAHTSELTSATKTLQTVTQKELMVVPNVPRFLREGDQITIAAKISNLTNNLLSGFATLILTDALSGKAINIELENLDTTKNFTVDKDGNTKVSWHLSIPETLQAVQYKIVAKAGAFSDGEQNVLPVLSNRMLVTESLAMWIGSNESKTFTLDKLKNNSSSTLKNHKLTLEMTSNPVWYAIQSLPYLMEYPYECAEQTFARYYANTLASFVANSNPRIQEVFNAWKSSDALLSNLEKNQALKSLIIQETPWLRDAQSETAQKKRIALLFDLNKMKNEQEKALHKLKDIQMNSGGFSWFKGGRSASNFITQHIATGFGHLQKLGVDNFDSSTQKMIEKTVHYLDEELLAQYEKLIKRATEIKETAKTKTIGIKKYKAYLAKNNLNYFTIQYLYMRSFYPSISLDKNTTKAIDYYSNQTTKYWNAYNLYAKGQIALSLFRSDQKAVAHKILKSLKEHSISSKELGMYWKSNTSGYYYYQAPIETQALLIEVFSEIENDTKTIDKLKIWLLKNKQTNRWKTTKATTEAVYALLLNGSDWISVTEMVDISIGDKSIDPKKLENEKVAAGTGYFKTSWKADEIKKEMATVSINKKGNGIAWGGLYWQYFEDLDKITPAETPLKLNKKLFLKVNSDTGKELQEITKSSKVKVGDIITIRIELESDRDMEFIHMKDMRASGVEPINVLSTYKWQDNLGYYESSKDAATHFFFDSLPKGIYVFEYDVRVHNAGSFSNGITSIQSMYAPEFSSHSKGFRINVLEK
ncbi:MG2 domain-containing protein [Polaribacter sp. MSW13]|uniref:MG2 domain-containing protein n=1 Tax=Polaribacter marinus TaxID=2916838 RepID=A0A9X1VUJ5_9FLAO|nr:MG2 domain-containing protein [Polaribacter marinus]MCI2229801.1 MG2 domain-containing protein [Polaribacter marinus]